ncbi:MAG TPA: deoxyribonuclease V [Candidatus Desulfobacillus sp.]|nr:deoxyribonuclease V [Candidatus Desulfobacillus sp.]
MPPRLRHGWRLTPKQAMALQTRLAGRIIRHDDFGPVRRVAGVDAGFEDGGATTRAAIALLDIPSLREEAAAVARQPTRFPYVPGLLSFREIPAVLAAMRRLGAAPDLLLCDGQGIAHPRRCGFASHLGLLLDIPSIGVAKTRLIGSHREPPDRRGAWVPLEDGGETIGAVLRTRRGVKPVYVSIGHRIGLESAVAMVLACLTRYRLPETTRRAHALASRPLKDS